MVSIPSHRPVSTEKHPKVNVILHDDFKQYPDEILEPLKDSRGVLGP